MFQKHDKSLKSFGSELQILLAMEMTQSRIRVLDQQNPLKRIKVM